MAPAILGQDPRSTEHVERAMDLQLPGHLYAKQPTANGKLYAPDTPGLGVAPCFETLGQPVARYA